MTPPTTCQVDRTPTPAATPHREVAEVRLPRGRGVGARAVIRQLGRLARTLPDRVAVVVVSVPSVEALTVELLTGIAISRRFLAAEGRNLVLRVPGEPTTSGAAALLGTIPHVVSPERTEPGV